MKVFTYCGQRNREGTKWFQTFKAELEQKGFTFLPSKFMVGMLQTEQLKYSIAEAEVVILVDQTDEDFFRLIQDMTRQSGKPLICFSQESDADITVEEIVKQIKMACKLSA
jgi:hypothetical protein